MHWKLSKTCILGSKKDFFRKKALNSKLGKTSKFLIKSLFNRFFADYKKFGYQPYLKPKRNHGIQQAGKNQDHPRAGSNR
ncbi:MAG TPA: hypothetical protein DEQ87_09080 [Algoriphagus sp.]|nr:hypothetical protein [Algoriphagus sp.]MAN87887.1 hypothetical protein [Algoriphagus sp.]HAD51658.1 hypothetical protein [Algoriphagus sp.]HAH35478.1 hypothetical protein [Algoriphagus sp.]HAS57280.1 hypothetical protein [Algoriphagus sp.]